MTSIAFVFSIASSAGSFAWGAAEMGLDLLRWLIAFGLLWLISEWRGWKWFSPFALFLSILAAMTGLWLNFSIGWMFSGAVFALVAWDMTELRKKLRLLPLREDAKGFERRHIARVSLLALGSLLFASILMAWWMQLSPEWGAFLLFVTALGLTQIFAWIRR